MYCGKTNLTYIGRPIDKSRNILIKPKKGEMPKYGHTYNILKVCSIEPVTKEQLNRFFQKPAKIINSAKKYGYITEKDGKFVLTSVGVAELDTLEVKFGSCGNWEEKT